MIRFWFPPFGDDPYRDGLISHEEDEAQQRDALLLRLLPGHAAVAALTGRARGATGARRRRDAGVIVASITPAIFQGVLVGAGEPCWIEASSFALRSSALWSALTDVALGILWAGAGCVT